MGGNYSSHNIECGAEEGNFFASEVYKQLKAFTGNSRRQERRSLNPVMKEARGH